MSTHVPASAATAYGPAAGHGCPVAFIGAALVERLPREGRLGTVIAVFHRSCYLETKDARLFCVADHRLGEGPLTLGVELPPGRILPDLAVTEGTVLEWVGPGLRLGRRLLLRTGAAAVWRPPPVGRLASPQKIRCRLRSLTSRIQGLVPEEGLGPLLRHIEPLAQGNLPYPEPAGPVARTAVPHVARLAAGVIAGDPRQVDQGVARLVGLGPGLTPSGDDLLAGLMLALSVISKAGAGNRKWCPPAPTRTALGAFVAGLARTIDSRAATGTSRISAALLEQCGNGAGSAAHHLLLRHLLHPAALPGAGAAALRVAGTGHCSGWDSLAGLVLGTYLGLAWLEAGTPTVLPPGDTELLPRPAVAGPA